MEDMLIAFVRKQFEDVGDVSLDNRLLDLGYESYSFIELVVAIEEEFDIEFDDEDLDFRRFDDLRALANYVSTRVTS